jgi:dephospho-CoA kinase
MKIVGLTGGIACGKSSVSRLLSTEFKVPIVDADEIAHIVLSPGTRTYAKVLKAFGTVILQDRVPAESNASSSRKDEVAKQPRPIDRKKLGDIVFTDDAKRKQLGQLMNGAIAWAMFRAVLFHWVKGTRVVVLDVPLL